MNKLKCFLFILAGIVSSCTARSKSDRSVKFEQYYVEGEQLYLTHCSNCHQQSGEGLGLLYPPLNHSDYMENNLERIICLIKNGKAGELIVNGKIYNQPMPGVASLTDLEIAEIATYIYNSWDHEKGIIDLKMVTATLTECANNME
ncbi:MAG TPA: cytochrome c [Cyclobacteriaceae bacterium]